MGKYFGTDGIRGKLTDLTPELAFRVGNALTQERGNMRVLIGRDTRTSGSLLTYSLASGVMAGGGDVFDTGIVTTPSIAFLTKLRGFDYGIMITASHNPAEYNGIKIFDCRGNKIDEKKENEIERKIKKIKYASVMRIGSYEDISKDSKGYIYYLLRNAEQMFDGYKIVLDCANGGASKLAPEVFKRLGVNVITICASLDGRKINRKCGATDVKALRDKVLKERADMGFAFDGDGDRIMVVSGSGEILSGDDLILIFADYMKSQNMLRNDTVVITQMSNMGLDEELSDRGIKTIRTDVGDKYVAQQMKKGFTLGGEQCGHIIIGSDATSGDGILAGIVLLNALSTKYSSLAQTPRFKPFFQFKADFEVEDKNVFLKNEHIAGFINKLKVKFGSRGRILVRASGTENKIRVLVESKEEREGQNVFQHIKDFVSSEVR